MHHRVLSFEFQLTENKKIGFDQRQRKRKLPFISLSHLLRLWISHLLSPAIIMKQQGPCYYNSLQKDICTVVCSNSPHGVGSFGEVVSETVRLCFCSLSVKIMTVTSEFHLHKSADLSFTVGTLLVALQRGLIALELPRRHSLKLKLWSTDRNKWFSFFCCNCT